MTTIDEALDTITKTVRQNEPSELAREIRLLRAEIARLSAEVAVLKSRPQVVPQPYPVYPYHPPYYPSVPTRPVVPFSPWWSPFTYQVTCGDTGTVRSDHFATITGPTVKLTNPVTLNVRDVDGFRDAVQFVQDLPDNLEMSLGRKIAP